MKKSIIVLILLAYQFSYSQWETISPFKPTIKCVALATSGKNVFAGCSSTGVYLSSDKGQNWVNKNAGTGIKPLKVNAIAVSGNNVFVATADSGVYLSTDMGDNWENKITGLSELNVTAIAAIADNVFVGTNGAGIFFSNNNGVNWEARNTGLGNLKIKSIAVEEGNIFVGTDGGGIYYSDNTGNSWSAKNEGLTENASTTIYSIALKGNDLVVSTGTGIFLSNDLGSQWTRLSSYGKALLIFSGNKIYAAYREYPFNLEVSTDVGNTWEVVNKQDLFANYLSNGLKLSVSKKILSLAVIDNNIIVGTGYDGIYVSTDTGANFEGKTFYDTDVNSIIISGENIFVTSSTFGYDYGTVGGIFRSTNMGNSWRNIGFLDQSINSLVLKEDTLFALQSREGLYYSTDLGDSWQVKDTTNLPGGLRKLVIYGNNWAIPSGSGLFLSTDSGNSWDLKDEGLDAGLYSIAFDGNDIFVGTGGMNNGKGVYLSTDLGESWTAKGLDSLHIYQIEISGNYVFAGTNEGLYRSTNFGETWELKFRDNISTSIIDFLLYENNLFISASGNNASNKVFVSKDMGETWFQKDSTLPSSHTSFTGNHITENFVVSGEYVYTIVPATSNIYRAKISDLLNPTSVKDENVVKNDFFIYPNPSTDFITIQIQTSEVLKTSEVYRVQIFDMLGIEIMSESIHPLTGSHRMNVEKLSAGVYFIRIGGKVEKFVKM